MRTRSTPRRRRWSLAVALLALLALAVPSRVRVGAALPPRVSVADIAPAAGTVAGGTTVAITGAGFAFGGSIPCSTAVTIGGQAVIAMAVLSDNQILCRTLARAAGAADVTVTVTRIGTGSGTLAAGYSYTAVPRNPSPVPQEFPTGGATQDVAACPDGNLWFTEGGSGMIGQITPAGVLTEFPIPTANGRPSGIAAGPDGNLWFGESTGRAIGALYVAPPRIAGISPLNVPANMPTTVTIAGSGFAPGTGIRIAGAAVPVLIDNPTRITAAAPAHAPGTVDVSVTSAGTTTTVHGFTYETPDALPPSLPPGPPTSGANALPVSRPAGGGTGSPSPLPVSRP